MWSGTIATIPDNFVLCDGNNGTPDLRNRFILGADHDQGGEAWSTPNGVPAKTGGAWLHSHNQASGLEIADSTPLGTQGFGTATSSSLCPFYALAYIMRI